MWLPDGVPINRVMNETFLVEFAIVLKIIKYMLFMINENNSNEKKVRNRDFILIRKSTSLATLRTLQNIPLT